MECDKLSYIAKYIKDIRYRIKIKKVVKLNEIHKMAIANRCFNWDALHRQRIFCKKYDGEN